MNEKNRYEITRNRLTEKIHQPTEEFIRHYMGTETWQRLMLLENMMRERYELNREMKFPFGNDYGWGYRYAHKKSLLLYVFFEEGSFCCTISINDNGAPKIDAMLNELLPGIQSAWQNRYPCGENGGWINYTVTHNDELPDLIRLIGIKVKPQNKIY